MANPEGLLRVTANPRGGEAQAIAKSVLNVYKSVLNVHKSVLNVYIENTTCKEVVLNVHSCVLGAPRIFGIV